jgi:hypothetical protein
MILIRPSGIPCIPFTQSIGPTTTTTTTAVIVGWTECVYITIQRKIVIALKRERETVSGVEQGEDIYNRSR